MKWLFATLVGLNLIVFAGMIASKMLKEYYPAPQAQNNTPPQTIIIQQPTAPVAPEAASGVKTVTTTGTNGTVVVKKEVAKPTSVITQPQHTKKETVSQTQTPQANYKNCSARVSMPEDDYHRIKGLLGKYPHAASRQVVEGGGEDGAQSSSRMNVLFMSVSDQDAGAIQAVVGRYGQLNRAPCNK